MEESCWYLLASTSPESFAQQKIKADMQKNPMDYPASIYLLVLGIAILGGLVDRLQRMVGGKTPHCWRCALVRLSVDALTSGFCGLLIFWLCEAMNVPFMWAAPIIGMGGHMGCRALFLMERIAIQRLERYAGDVEAENKQEQDSD